MPPKRQPPTPVFIDPNREPIRAVDQVSFHHSRTSHLDITCCAHVASMTSEKTVVECIVVARLRMDVSMAKAFAEGLAKQIAMLEAAEHPIN